MSSINDKLNYLSETKTLIRDKMREKGCEISDDDTFRSYIEKIDEINPFNYIMMAINGNPKIEHTILGDIELGENYLCAPSIIYPDEDREFILPFNDYSYQLNRENTALLFHNIKVQGDKPTLVCMCYTYAPAAVIFPSNINLVTKTLCTNKNSSVFSIGLGFGKSIKYSSSSWLYTSLTAFRQKIVKIEKDFKMPSGVTFYLNKLLITQECMKEMVEHLYDYIGNGETTEVTRTISVGSTNKALLTEDEIQVAANKGWKITV